MDESEAPPALWRTLLLAVLVLTWRVATLPASLLWKDWIGIIAVYFVIKRLTRCGQYSSLATLMTVTLLLGIYLYGQWPYTLLTLGRAR